MQRNPAYAEFMKKKRDEEMMLRDPGYAAYLTQRMKNEEESAERDLAYAPYHHQGPAPYPAMHFHLNSLGQRVQLQSQRPSMQLGTGMAEFAMQQSTMLENERILRDTLVASAAYEDAQAAGIKRKILEDQHNQSMQRAHMLKQRLHNYTQVTPSHARGEYDNGLASWMGAMRDPNHLRMLN